MDISRAELFAWLNAHGLHAQTSCCSQVSGEHLPHCVQAKRETPLPPRTAIAYYQAVVEAVESRGFLLEERSR